MEYLFFIIIVVVVLILLKIAVRRVIIFEYENGLKYNRGKFKKVMDPGQYWYTPYLITIMKIDVRPRFISITGQEVLSSDGVTLKVSIAANYEISDPNMAINKVQNYQEALYLELQLALREIIGTADIDTVLDNRNELSRKLKEATEKKAQDLGLKLISVNVKDIMFPGKLKEMFAQVVNARKEGLAAIEKARGETAALRNLANAAKMIETNPNLLQLRLLQTLGASSGNTLILGMPANTSVIPIKGKEGAKEKVLPDEEPEQP